MQIEEVTHNTPDNGSGVHFFTAVLFEDWEFWTAGPSGHIREQVLIELALYQSVERAILVKVYVPRIN